MSHYHDNLYLEKRKTPVWGNHGMVTRPDGTLKARVVSRTPALRRTEDLVFLDVEVDHPGVRAHARAVDGELPRSLALGPVLRHVEVVTAWVRQIQALLPRYEPHELLPRGQIHHRRTREIPIQRIRNWYRGLDFLGVLGHRLGLRGRQLAGGLFGDHRCPGHEERDGGAKKDRYTEQPKLHCFTSFKVLPLLQPTTGCDELENGGVIFERLPAVGRNPVAYFSPAKYFPPDRPTRSQRVRHEKQPTQDEIHLQSGSTKGCETDE